MVRHGIWAWVLLACLALSSASLAVPRITRDAGNALVSPPMRALPVHVGGRVNATRLQGPVPKGAMSYLHQWPGVYFEAAFKGDSVTLKFDDSENNYRLLIDSLAPIPLPPPGRAEIRIDALEPGRHWLRLEKLTRGTGSFQGFYVPADAAVLPVRARSPQIEFIGDSSMTGFGDLSPKVECTDEQGSLLTDTQQAYPALVARHFDADYQINAWGGIGLVRNYGGFDPSIVMPRIHPYVIMGDTRPYADPDWRPQIIVIRLIADLVAPLGPHEGWWNFAQLEEAYVKGYGAFIARLHRSSPGASFLIWWVEGVGDRAPGAEGALNGWQRRIAADAKAAGVAYLDFLPERAAGFERTGCGGHYSLADHRAMARQMIAYLDAHPQLWQRR